MLGSSTVLCGPGITSVVIFTSTCLLYTGGLLRGRVKELPPPDVMSQQKLSEVTEALRSGGNSKKWQKLDQVGEEQKYLSKCSKRIHKEIKEADTQNHTRTHTNSTKTAQFPSIHRFPLAK